MDMSGRASIGRIRQNDQEFWRPVRELNPCYRREREENHCNSRKLRGMDSTLPHLKDSGERLLDA